MFLVDKGEDKVGSVVLGENFNYLGSRIPLQFRRGGVEVLRSSRLWR